MTAAVDHARARRYFLGTATDTERADIEEAFVTGDEAFEQMTAAEEELIEEYVHGELNSVDRVHFEQAYLAVPAHRVRVETVRRLIAHARSSSSGPQRARPRRVVWSLPTLALAASLVLVAGVAWWVARQDHLPAESTSAGGQAAGGAAVAGGEGQVAKPEARVFAIALAPAGVRGATEDTGALVPVDATTISLRLQSDGEPTTLVATRVSIRLVSGRGVWQGPVRPASADSPGVLAEVDLPATQLPTDDYLLTLFGADASGVEREWQQYFLRIRR